MSKMTNETDAHYRPELLQSVITAHGGLERWNKINSIDLTLNFSGQSLAARGWPGKYKPNVTISTKESRSVTVGFDPDKPYERWVYTPNRTSIERQDGTTIAALDTPRATFSGYTRATPWDELHLMYFFGYAMHNYLTTPFDFVNPGFQTREIGPHEENGEVWRVLEVTFPDDYTTHCKTQLFYFDEKKFMLQRIDYNPVVMGGATASHYCFDHKEISGIMIPMTRRVVLRAPPQGGNGLGGRTLLSGPTAFLLDYCKVILHDA
jgi:hypothetical protein